VWYGLPGGYAQTDLTGDGQQARLVLTGGPQGKVTIAATLGKDDQQLQCVWDTHDLGPQTAQFYLMNHVSAMAKPDVLVVPGKAGPVRLERGARTLAAGDLPAPWAAVESQDGLEALGVAYDFPALQGLTLMHGGGGPNYVLFTPKPEPPGKITFWLTGRQGSAETIAAWAAQLPRP